MNRQKRQQHDTERHRGGAGEASAHFGDALLAGGCSTTFPLPFLGCPLPFLDYPLHFLDRSLPLLCHSFTVHCVSFISSTVHRLPSTVHHLPSTAHLLPSTALLCLPSTAHRLPSTRQRTVLAPPVQVRGGSRRPRTLTPVGGGGGRPTGRAGRGACATLCMTSFA